MVISIDVLRSGAGLVDAEAWAEAERPTRGGSGEDFDPARGMALGLLLGAVLWVGLIAAVRGIALLLG
jgi:hypothetical protein